jgi:hypothetical protein
MTAIVAATTHNICDLVNQREWNLEERKKRRISYYQSLQAEKIPATLKERLLNTTNHDKVFVAHWLNPTQVVLGTKCNQLYVLHVDTGKKLDIALIDTKGKKYRNDLHMSLPSASRPMRPTATATTTTTTATTLPWNHSSPRWPEIHHMDAIFNSHSAMAYQTEMEATTLMLQVMESRVSHAGIHSISINPSNTWLATGAVDAHHIGIYRLPSLKPYALCIGHIDWLFATEWLSDTILVSGSRDSSLAMWDMADMEENSQTTVVKLEM